MRRHRLEGLPGRVRRTAWLALEGQRQRRLPFASLAAVEREQRRRVASAVAHAYRHVPHYREAMRRQGLDPGDIRTAADLARLPAIDRRQVQRDPERFVSRARRIESLRRSRSGGSSGEPITVFRDRSALLADAAHEERQLSIALALAGHRLRARELVISSPLRSGASAGTSLREAIVGHGRVRVVARHVSLLDPLERAAEALDDFRPHLLRSYGSYLDELFLHLRRRRAPVHLPRVVRYAGDRMSDPVRRLVSQELGMAVLSSYAAIEAPSIGFECERHEGLHLNVDLCPLRIVDSDGRETGAGETGAVVISDLVSRGTMLLNYRLDDLAARLPAPCSCGRTLPLLSFLEGRTNEWLASEAGERVYSLGVRTLFTAEPDVLRYQVVQRAPSRFDLAVVAADGCDREALTARIIRGFAGRFGQGAAVEVRFADSLPRTPLGKVRSVIGMGDGAPR